MKLLSALILTALISSPAMAADFTVSFTPADSSVNNQQVGSITTSKISDFISAITSMANRVISNDNSGTTVINTSQTFTAASTIPNTIETAFGNTAAGAFALTLPDPTLNKSKKLIISKINSGANLLTVTGSIAGTIRSTVLHAQSEQIQLQSDGTTWQWISDAYRREYVYTPNSNCTSSPCVISAQSGNWVTTLVRGSTGTYGVNFVSGIFSAPPACICTSLNTNSSSGTCGENSFTSTGNWGFVTYNQSGGSPVDSQFTLVCTGLR